MPLSQFIYPLPNVCQELDALNSKESPSANFVRTDAGYGAIRLLSLFFRWQKTVAREMISLPKPKKYL